MNTALRLFALALPAVLVSSVHAHDCCMPCERIVSRVVYEEVPYTACRIEYETVTEQRQVTTQRPVYETEQRVRRYRVAKPVTETATREERFFTLKPVYETEERTREYDVTTWETVTETRQDRVLVSRPVVETQMQERQHVMRKAVQDTVWQDQAYTQMTPVTTMRTQLVDQGSFVDTVNYVPGHSHCCLGWMPRGASTNAVTGETYYRRGGLAWVPRTSPGTYAVSRAYVPNLVAQQVPVTSMMPQTVVQKVPLAVTRYEDEVVTEQVPVTVERMEQCEEIRETPVTYQRPKTEHVVEKIPVQTLRYEREEQVRQVPYTIQRIEYEDREEPYEVKVLRWETETQTIEVPVQRQKLVEYTAYRLVPRVVTMRLPFDAPMPVENGAIIRRPALPVLPPASRSVVKKPATNGTKSGEPNPAEKLEKIPQDKNGAKKPPAPGETDDAKPTPKPGLENGDEDLKLENPGEKAKKDSSKPADESKKKDGKMAYGAPRRQL
ncbi:MAG TPA: hypothetical protein VFB96_04930 [Pirellulaceae bacterium]|nr:hypothetical protein [Pirellulaceae bacterium]